MYGEGRNDGEPYTITLVNDELAGKKGKKKYFISFTHFSVNFSKYNMKKKKIKGGKRFRNGSSKWGRGNEA